MKQSLPAILFFFLMGLSADVLLAAATAPTVEDAYVEQVSRVSKQKQQDAISGYKAGLTSAAGQAKFKVDGPLHGVLFESGHINNGESIKLSDYYRLMIETEIGFVLKESISHPVESVTEVKSKIAHIVAVIELPDVRFENLKTVTGIDLIVNNVAAKAYIISEQTFSIDAFDLNQIQVRLRKDNTDVNSGKGSDASGDQWQALLWLINSSLQTGYEIKAGQLMITGALGNMVKAEPGTYQAVYSELGSIEFQIQ